MKISLDSATSLRYLPVLNPIEKKKMAEWLDVSETIEGFLWRDRLACIWGVVPASLLSMSGLLWSYSTPVLDECKTAFGRFSIRDMRNLLRKYPDGLYGYTTEESEHWLRSLGAVFTPGSPMRFRING